MKNNRFIQCFLWEKQKSKHRKAYFHLIVFATIVIFSEINKIGCSDKSGNKKYNDNEETYFDHDAENTQEDFNYDPWRDSERPKLFVDYLSGPLKGEVDRFVGNRTAIDNFKLMEEDGRFLLIGATNNVYFLNPRNLRELKKLRIEWHPNPTDFELCTMKGKSKAECQNHIRIVAKMDKEKLLLCGTQAYRPRCRSYILKEGQYVVEKDFEGVGLTPYSPYHNSSFVYSDGELYSATVSDFSGSDPLIYKRALENDQEPLRTDQFDSKHLNSPDFVRSLADGDYVYFFFREQAVEYINCGKSVFSRVARVCKSDKGGPKKYKSSWTTFLKSRLNCSLPGEYPFYFDHLQATSDIIDGDYGGSADRIIYAVFTTPINSIAGNAICAFRLRDLLDTFEGSFKEQETANSNWLPVVKIKEPHPRPGRCSADSQSIPESTLSFVKGHSIMDEAVPAFGGRPIFVRANLKAPSQFRELTVDSQVSTPDGQSYDILFVGTTKGSILKIVNIAGPSQSNLATRPIFIEELLLFPQDVTIGKLKIVRPQSTMNINSQEGKEPRLIVLTKADVVSIPVARCKVAKSCHECVLLQDPYCAWDVEVGRCTALYDVIRYPDGSGEPDAGRYLQNVVSGKHSRCGPPTQNLASRNSGAYSFNSIQERNGVHFLLTKEGLMAPPSSDRILDQGFPNNKHITDEIEIEGVDIIAVPSDNVLNVAHYSAEELSMAVATSCVCALVLGFITGFLMARKCVCGEHRDGDHPYHVPYLTQSGYHADEIYAKVDDMTYYPVNSMLVSLPTTAATTAGSTVSSSNNNHAQFTHNSINHSSTASTIRAGASNDRFPPPLPSLPPGIPTPPGAPASTKTLNLHNYHGQHTTLVNPRQSDFNVAFGTVHRSQKIYL